MAKSYSAILLQFLRVLCIVEENKWHIWSPEECLTRKHVLFMQKVISKSDLFNMTLAWHPSKLQLDNVIGPNGQNYRYLRWKWPKLYRMTCLWLLFIYWPLWPDLGLIPFKYDLRSHAVGTFPTHIIALWVSLSTLWPVYPIRAQNVKMVFLTSD